MSEVSINCQYEVFSLLPYDDFKKENFFDLLVGFVTIKE